MKGRQRGIPWSRYPFPALRVWILAEQSYCEKRVDLWLEEPGERVSIPRQMEGTDEAAALALAAASGREVHATAASQAAPIAPWWLSLLQATDRPYVLVETLFRAEFAGLPVEGIPDAAMFKGRAAELVLDYKLSSASELHMGFRAQLCMYGYLVEESGFDVSDLQLACVMVPPAAKEAFAECAERLAKEVHQRTKSGKRPSASGKRRLKLLCQGVPVRAFVWTYDRSRAIAELKFVTQYWLGLRPPQPTRNPAKCACCLYNRLGLCPDARAPFSGPTEPARG